MKKWIGVLGYPLTHSLSKSFHEKKLKERHLDIDFHLLEWEPRYFENRVASLKQDSSCVGFSVTMPFKEAITPYVDAFDPISEKTGVVNAVKNNNGKWFGLNTDGPGFLKSLKFWQSPPPISATTVFLGAGATAKTLSFMLANAGYREFIFLKRGGATCGGSATKDLPRSHLFILNTTPLFTADKFFENLNIEKLTPPVWFFDVIYNPSSTWLLGEFRKRSFYTMNGYGMFEAQARLSFKQWFSS